MKNAFKLHITSIIALLFIFSSIAQAQKEPTKEEIAKVEKIFETANVLMEQKKFDEALSKYKEALAIVPNSLGLLFNGGLAAFETKNFNQALEFWKKVKELDREDWQVRAKLVQTYQNLGKFAERDAERKELFELRKSGKIKDLSAAEFYVREQSEFGGRKVMVFEHFELKGDRALRYVFYILNGNGKPDFRISLGSYETTNRIWREMQKRKPDERLFHLDGYFQNGGHATYGMYAKEPTYDETREIVKQILEKQKKPVSSTTIVNPSVEQPKKENPE